MRLLAAALVAVLALSACGEQAAPTGSAAEAPDPAAFCSEHGVAEAVCTRCNPKLIPIFQDKGDWCAEHGFPESFCPTCHPELGGRPAMDLAPGAPPDGTIVQLASRETARVAGIETVPAREETLAGEVLVLGAIAWDGARRAEINARLPGVVREVLVELGGHVEAGSSLVRIGSAEVGTLRAARQAADARIAAARPALERQQALHDRGLGSLRDVQAAQAELTAATAESEAAQAALDVVGLVSESGSDYTLVSPFAGTCVRCNATVGRMVAANDPVCEIVDTRSVWAELEVPEAQLGRVHAGQPVTVTADILGAREFRGTIDHVVPEIEPHTRTVKARVRLDNPDGALRANLFVRARIALGTEEVRVLVPRDAVQHARGEQFVFVELAPDRFEARRASVVGALGDLVALGKGARAGERVATRGSFLLKTEILKGDIGAGCCVEE
jgi:membrane fusion protein, heavy metal efflux system